MVDYEVKLNGQRRNNLIKIQLEASSPSWEELRLIIGPLDTIIKQGKKKKRRRLLNVNREQKKEKEMSNIKK